MAKSLAEFHDEAAVARQQWNATQAVENGMQLRYDALAGDPVMARVHLGFKRVRALGEELDAAHYQAHRAWMTMMAADIAILKLYNGLFDAMGIEG